MKMGSKSRRKGSEFEREIVNAFKKAGIFAERRAPMQANAYSDDADVVADGVGRIEAKRRTRGFKIIYDALDGVDAVVIRDDRKPALIVFDLESYINREVK